MRASRERQKVEKTRRDEPSSFELKLTALRINMSHNSRSRPQNNKST